MKYRSLLRVIASQIALVFVLFFVIQGEDFAVARGGGGERDEVAADEVAVEEVAAFPAEVQRAEASFRLVRASSQGARTGST